MYSYKTLTPEQQEKRDARRANFKALLEHLKEMNEVDRNEFSSVSICNPDGHILSSVNTILINLQRPGCTIVAGYQQWKRYHRYVIRGESGISIWIPTNAPKSDDEESPDRILFSTQTVFDISQTEVQRTEEALVGRTNPIAVAPVRRPLPVNARILEHVKEYLS
jgi:hypothetical protein